MSLRSVFALVAAALVLGGCRFDAAVPPEAEIRCMGGCPSGWECRSRINRCRRAEDGAPPELTGVTVSPRRGSRGTTFVFSGTSNHRLWPESAPALELFAGATVTSVSPSPGWEEGTLRWEWRADAPDLASMNLSALTELVDVEGRARRERLGSITLDVDSPRSLPAVGRVLLPIDSVLPLDEVRALAAGARLELTVVFDEPLGAGGPLVRCVGAGSVDAIDFEPPTAVGPAWFFRGTVKPGAPQGLCQFAVTARDEVGNEGTRPLSVIGLPSDTSTESGVTEYLIDTVAPPPPNVGRDEAYVVVRRPWDGSGTPTAVEFGSSPEPDEWRLFFTSDPLNLVGRGSLLERNDAELVPDGSKRSFALDDSVDRPEVWVFVVDRAGNRSPPAFIVDGRVTISTAGATFIGSTAVHRAQLWPFSPEGLSVVNGALATDVSVDLVRNQRTPRIEPASFVWDRPPTAVEALSAVSCVEDVVRGRTLLFAGTSVNVYRHGGWRPTTESLPLPLLQGAQVGVSRSDGTVVVVTPTDAGTLRTAFSTESGWGLPPTTPPGLRMMRSSVAGQPLMGWTPSARCTFEFNAWSCVSDGGVPPGTLVTGGQAADALVLRSSVVDGGLIESLARVPLAGPMSIVAERNVTGDPTTALVWDPLRKKPWVVSTRKVYEVDAGTLVPVMSVPVGGPVEAACMDLQTGAVLLLRRANGLLETAEAVFDGGTPVFRKGLPRERALRWPVLARDPQSGKALLTGELLPPDGSVVSATVSDYGGWGEFELGSQVSATVFHSIQTRSDGGLGLVRLISWPDGGRSCSQHGRAVDGGWAGGSALEGCGTGDTVTSDGLAQYGVPGFRPDGTRAVGQNTTSQLTPPQVRPSVFNLNGSWWSLGGFEVQGLETSPSVLRLEADAGWATATTSGSAIGGASAVLMDGGSQPAMLLFGLDVAAQSTSLLKFRQACRAVLIAVPPELQSGETALMGAGDSVVQVSNTGLPGSDPCQPPLRPSRLSGFDGQQLTSLGEPLDPHLVGVPVSRAFAATLLRPDGTVLGYGGMSQTFQWLDDGFELRQADRPAIHVGLRAPPGLEPATVLRSVKLDVVTTTGTQTEVDVWLEDRFSRVSSSSVSQLEGRLLTEVFSTWGAMNVRVRSTRARGPVDVSSLSTSLRYRRPTR